MANKDQQLPADQPPTLIQVREIRRRLGNISAMWLRRHEHELPVPIRIGKRRYWVESEFVNYVERLKELRGTNSL